MPDPTPTIPPPRPSTPPVPLHKRPITAREIVQAVAVSLAVAIMVAARFPSAMTVIAQVASMIAGIVGQTGLEVTPAMVAACGTSFVVGCFWPGSPLGRLLDWIASFFGGPQVSFTLADAQAAKDAIVPPTAPPQRIPPSREGGHASIDVLLALVSLLALAWAAVRAWGPAILVALGLAGCGASALSQHANGVAVAMVAVRGAEDAADAERRSVEDACSTEVCLTAAVTARRPVVAALDEARTAVLAWRHAVQVALQSAGGADVLSALETAAARVLARWADLAAALVPLGVTLPTLPASVAALVPSGGAS